MGIYEMAEGMEEVDQMNVIHAIYAIHTSRNSLVRIVEQTTLRFIYSAASSIHNPADTLDGTACLLSEPNVLWIPFSRPTDVSLPEYMGYFMRSSV